MRSGPESLGEAIMGMHCWHSRNTNRHLGSRRTCFESGHVQPVTHWAFALDIELVLKPTSEAW